MTTPQLTDWPHLYREGDSGRPLLLMLHGTGSHEEDIAALAAQPVHRAGHAAFDIAQFFQAPEQCLGKLPAIAGLFL